MTFYMKYIVWRTLIRDLYIHIIMINNRIQRRNI